MAKMKTKRAAAKRFKVTATGKVKVKKAGLRHILTKKSRGLKRNKRAPGLVHETQVHEVKRAVPYLF